MPTTQVFTTDNTLLASFDETKMQVFLGEKAVLVFEKEGTISINGEKVVEDKNAVYALRQFLKHFESGDIKTTDTEE